MNWVEAWNELEKFIKDHRTMCLAQERSIGGMCEAALCDEVLQMMSQLFIRIETGAQL